MEEIVFHFHPDLAPGGSLMVSVGGEIADQAETDCILQALNSEEGKAVIARLAAEAWAKLMAEEPDK